MYSDEDITAAINAGVLTKDNANSFRLFIAKSKATTNVDEEHFRLIGGFNDIFVVIACILLLVSVTWIGSAVSNWLGSVTATITAWLLAEFFTRKRKMALPSIVLLLAFVGNIYYSCFALLELTASGALIAAALSALGAWMHWLRFKVPITVAAFIAACIGFIVTLILKFVPESTSYLALISLISGLAVFAYAMHWDSSDIHRQSKKSDVAFWLHLLAAPLLVHPVFSLLNILDDQVNWIKGLIVVFLYILIAVASVAIDRRALMVSALAYVLYVLSHLLNDYGVVNLGFAITALVIGSALLLLSAYWHPCRKFVLQKMPLSIQNKLAPY